MNAGCERVQGWRVHHNHFLKGLCDRALVADAAIGRQYRGRPVVGCPAFKFGVNLSTL